MIPSKPSPPVLNSETLRAALSQSAHQHWILFLVEGLVLTALGALAIVVPAIASLAITFFVGWLFMVGGAVGFILTALGRKAPGFLWSLLSAALAIVVGGLLIWWPMRGVVSLTLVLAAYFIVDGVASIMFAIEHRRHLSRAWGWPLASGIVDLFLASIIISGFPATADWVVGLIVGVDLIFGGSALVAMAMDARKTAL